MTNVTCSFPGPNLILCRQRFERIFKAQSMCARVQSPEGTAGKRTATSSTVGQHAPGKPQGVHAPVQMHKRHAMFPAPSRRLSMNTDSAAHAAPTTKASVHFPYPHQPLEGTPLPALPLKPLKRTETNLDIERIEPNYCM